MKLAKATIKKILERPVEYDWSLQGFGMLWLYLTKTFRLHIWSPYHMRNTRFNANTGGVFPKNYTQRTIQCGPGGCEKPGVIDVDLYPVSTEFIVEGQTYRQLSHEIHESMPYPGAVTVIERIFKKDTEHALVFSPIGQPWRSAEPRKAEPHEIREICNMSLDLYFGDVK